MIPSLLTVITLELDAFFDKPDVMTSSVSSGFPCLVSTISDNSKLQISPGIKSGKLWCQVRMLILSGAQNVSLLVDSLLYPVIQEHLG